MLAAAHRQRLRVAEVDDHVARRRVVGRVGQPAQPAERLAAVRHAGVPEAHRREVRQARMVVAAAVDDRQQAVLVEPLEADHRRMEAEAVGDLDDLALGDPELRPGAVVRGVAERARRCSSRRCRPTARRRRGSGRDASRRWCPASACAASAADVRLEDAAAAPRRRRCRTARGRESRGANTNS